MQKLIVLTVLFMMASCINAQKKEMNISVAGYSFSVTLEDNTTGQAFADMLPLTLTMNELNGNEKYCYLDMTLPTNTYRPGTIQEGDIMLYGNNCIVIFYKTFNTGYSYSRIGHINNTDHLQAALGSGNPSVTFELATTGISSVKTESEKEDYTMINGTKTTAPKQGIYIKNGKKFINK
ncbi:MAG: hypothetical protein IJV27_01350 [Prevotella sp.]|nr:hypothetical protein [Prevotella sp.]